MSESVAGYCPACGNSTLILGSGGFVVCSWLECRNPTAVSDILGDRETQHIVQLDEDGFTVRHPLIERLDDVLMTCGLHARIAALDGPPRALGRYRVHWRSKVGSSLGFWVRIPEKEATDGA